MREIDICRGSSCGQLELLWFYFRNRHRPALADVGKGIAEDAPSPYGKLGLRKKGSGEDLFLKNLLGEGRITCCFIF